MANWNNPTLTSTYTNFVSEVKDRDVEAAVWFEGMSPTNLPTNAKRLNTSTGRFEKWNGSAWVDAVATFTFPALTVAGAATLNGNTTIGDAGTDTLTVNAAAMFNGNVTLGDAAGDAVTVNATLSFATAPVLTSGAANGIAYLNGSKVLTAGSALTFDGSTVSIAANVLQTGGNFFTSTTSGYFFAGAGSFAGGIYGSAAGSLANIIAPTAIVGIIGASEQWRATVNGFGVGVNSPAARFEVEQTTLGNVNVIHAKKGDNVDFSRSPIVLLENTTGTGSINHRVGLRFQSYNSSNVLTSAEMRWEAGAGLAWYLNDTERLRLDSSANLIGAGTGYWRIPQGTTAQRPTGASGMMRFNTSLNKYEGHNGTAWSSIGGGATGGGSDDIFHENGQTVTTDYTITASKNAMSAGPITISSGITVTVPSGSTWVVV